MVSTVTTATGTMLLGALAPGNYQFNVVNDGQVERLIPFSVAADGRPSLTGTTRLPDGQVRFQVQGLAPFRYTVEGSLDLKEWFPLGANPGLFLFTDPDARFEEQRFYRVRVE